MREEVKWNSLTRRNRICALPLIRGVISFVESLIYGYRALMRSADLSGMLETEDGEKEDGSGKKVMAVVGAISTVLGFALAIGLFVYLPTLLFNGVNALSGGHLSGWKVVIEAVTKIALFVGYLCAVTLMKDVRRTFMYHGAEHKTIFCYEKALPLTVENVRKQRRFHPRCGTSFMILMLLVSIFVNAVLLALWPEFAQHTVLWGFAKIAMIPLICGIGYELIRACGKHDNWITRIISAPGMWLQRATTKEPDDSMIEIAIDALSAVIPENPEDDRLA